MCPPSASLSDCKFYLPHNNICVISQLLTTTLLLTEYFYSSPCHFPPAATYVEIHLSDSILYSIHNHVKL